MQAKKLLEDIARSLVDSPDGVTVVEKENSDGSLTLELSVAEGEMGKIIGKGGRVARSIRGVMKSASSVAGRKIFLEIKD